MPVSSHTDTLHRILAREQFLAAVVELVAAEKEPERHMAEITAIEELRPEVGAADYGGRLAHEVRISGTHRDGHTVFAFFPGGMGAFVARLLGQHAESKGGQQ